MLYADFMNLVVARCLATTLPSTKQVELEAHPLLVLGLLNSVKVRRKSSKPSGDGWSETCGFKQYECNSVFKFWILCLRIHIAYCTTEMSN